MPTLLPNDIVLDFDFYPRKETSKEHVRMMCAALDVGIAFPPLIVDEESKTLVDGYHRLVSWCKVRGGTTPVAVNFKKYASRQEMFLDAIRRNAGHGRPLAEEDRLHCVAVAKKLQVSPDAVAGALSMTAIAVKKLTVRKDAIVQAGQQSHPPSEPGIWGGNPQYGRGPAPVSNRGEYDEAKRTDQLFYLNQVIWAIENGYLKWDDETVLRQIKKLHRLIKSAPDFVVAGRAS